MTLNPVDSEGNPKYIKNRDGRLIRYPYHKPAEKDVCHDCDEKLTQQEKLSLQADGTTAGTYPKRPVCHNCEGGRNVQMEKEGY